MRYVHYLTYLILNSLIYLLHGADYDAGDDACLQKITLALRYFILSLLFSCHFNLLSVIIY